MFFLGCDEFVEELGRTADVDALQSQYPFFFDSLAEA